jgi:hypothetical protein
MGDTAGGQRTRSLPKRRAGPVSQRLVSTVESRAPFELRDAQPDDLIALDDPAQAVASSIGRRPERAEASIFVDVPLALCGTTVRLDVARVPAYSNVCVAPSSKSSSPAVTARGIREAATGSPSTTSTSSNPCTGLLYWPTPASRARLRRKNRVSVDNVGRRVRWRDCGERRFDLSALSTARSSDSGCRTAYRMWPSSQNRIPPGQRERH